MYRPKHINNANRYNLNVSSLKNNNIDIDRNFPVSTKVWNNSTYNFNKNTTKNIPFLDIVVNNIIKVYFNLTANVNLDSKFRRRRTKIQRYSGNRTFVNKTEMKHNNDKVLITLYTYNRSKKHIYKTLFSKYKILFTNISNKILYRYIRILLKNNKFNNNKYVTLLKNKYIEWLLNHRNVIKYRELTDFLSNNKNNVNNKKIFAFKRLLKKNKKTFNLKKFYLIAHLKKLLIYNYFQKSKFTNFNIYNKLRWVNFKSYNLLINYIDKFKFISNALKENNLTYIVNNMKKSSNILTKNISYIYLDKLKDNFIKKALSKEILYMNYNQLSLVEDYKFTNIYLNRLSYILSKIYNKKVEFNLINLKYIHLDSTILSKSIALKSRNRRNSPMRIIKKALSLANINQGIKYRYSIKNKYIKSYNAITMHNIDNKYIEYDKVNLVLNKVFNNESYINSNYELKNKYIYRSIKLRKIRGIRMEIKGRLSRRLAASKTVYRYRYKGSLQNLNNVIGLSSTLLKGFQKSNIDYININSKTRNGKFGLKGWISSK